MILDRIALILAIVGGLNWGSIGIFNFDFVSALLGQNTMLSRIVFTLVGLAAVWSISLLFRQRDPVTDLKKRADWLSFFSHLLPQGETSHIF